MNKNPHFKLHGAKAAIYIRFNGDLPALAVKISTALKVGDFDVGPREIPPHDLMASGECLGWELWLEHRQVGIPFQYSFRMETEHSLEESFNDDMYDLSPWFARYISLVCNVETQAAGTDVVFSRGQQQAKH